MILPPVRAAVYAHQNAGARPEAMSIAGAGTALGVHTDLEGAQ